MKYGVIDTYLPGSRKRLKKYWIRLECLPMHSSQRSSMLWIRPATPSNNNVSNGRLHIAYHFFGSHNNTFIENQNRDMKKAQESSFETDNKALISFMKLLYASIDPNFCRVALHCSISLTVYYDITRQDERLTFTSECNWKRLESSFENGLDCDSMDNLTLFSSRPLLSWVMIEKSNWEQ